jgi:hypothetical protein
VRNNFLCLFALTDRHPFRCDAEVELKKPFIDASEMTDAKGFVIYENTLECLLILISRKEI